MGRSKYYFKLSIFLKIHIQHTRQKKKIRGSMRAVSTFTYRKHLNSGTPRPCRDQRVSYVSHGYFPFFLQILLVMLFVIPAPFHFLYGTHGEVICTLLYRLLSPCLWHLSVAHGLPTQGRGLRLQNLHLLRTNI